MVKAIAAHNKKNFKAVRAFVIIIRIIKKNVV